MKCSIERARHDLDYNKSTGASGRTQPVKDCATIRLFERYHCRRPTAPSMSLDPVETLQQLIRIPSVNPLGRAEGDANCGEARLTDYLQGLCEQLGWRWLRQEVHPGRENLLAVVPGNPPAREGGELQLWDVHQDTVAADGMSVDPFGGELRDSGSTVAGPATTKVRWRR